MKYFQHQTTSVTAEETNRQLGEQGWRIVGITNNNTYHWERESYHVEDLATKVQNVLSKLDQNFLFIKSYEPADYTRTLGQYAVDLTFTNGDRQVLTTPSTKDNVFDRAEFKDQQEFWDFVKYLESNNIPKTK